MTSYNPSCPIGTLPVQTVYIRSLLCIDRMQVPGSNMLHRSSINQVIVGLMSLFKNFGSISSDEERFGSNRKDLFIVWPKEARAADLKKKKTFCLV